MSETQKRREELAIFVTYFFNDSKQTYGYRRVHKALERNGVATSPETVRRLMRQEGLVACQPRPKAHNYRACCRPGRAPRPDRKELHG